MIKSGFFNSLNGDRKYSADDLSDFYLNLITDGVIDSDTENFMVELDSGFTVKISKGWGFIKGKYIHNTTDYCLTLQSASQAFTRIDRVVLKLDTSLDSRKISIEVKQGSFSSEPIPPDLTRNDSVYELSLARITVRAKSAALTSADIIDERPDINVCGFARIKNSLAAKSAFDNNDIDDIFNFLEEIESTISRLVSDTKTNLSTQINTAEVRILEKIEAATYEILERIGIGELDGCFSLSDFINKKIESLGAAISRTEEKVGSLSEEIFSVKTEILKAFTRLSDELAVGNGSISGQGAIVMQGAISYSTAGTVTEGEKTIE